MFPAKKKEDLPETRVLGRGEKNSSISVEKGIMSTAVERLRGEKKKKEKREGPADLPRGKKEG